MLDRNIDDYPEYHRQTWVQVQERHPDRTSVCGALFAEITSTSASIDDRSRAADLYRFFSYKRGLRTFDKLASEFCTAIITKFNEPDDFPWGPERNFYGTLLFAIARIDSPESHSVLKGYLSSIESPHLRADVLEAMAFEENEFDAELVFRILEEETDEPILLSALYALLYRTPPIGADTLRQRISSFLKHDSGRVRSYTVQVLQFDSESLGAISKLADDPDSEVQRAVAEAIRFNEWDGEGSYTTLAASELLDHTGGR